MSFFRIEEDECGRAIEIKRMVFHLFIFVHHYRTAITWASTDLHVLIIWWQVVTMTLNKINKEEIKWLRCQFRRLE